MKKRGIIKLLPELSRGLLWNLDSGTSPEVIKLMYRTISADYKFSVYVRIMRNLLEEDEAIQAMQFLNRANLLIHETKNVEYILFFKLCQARILDATRRFLDAASKYRNPSPLTPLTDDTDDLSFEQMVDETERMKCLSAAITCAVLAPAGPARSRILATLYKDDRTAQNLPTDHAILEKMHFLRLLTTQEVNEFAKSLKPHQLALLPGDNNAQQVTVLSNAVLEHNLAAASRVYRNIAFDELGKLLGVDGMEAERYAATMIEQGRMKGWIDQPDGIIYFEEDFGGEGGMTGRVQRNWSQIIRWDEAIKELCAHVESVASVYHPPPFFYWANSLGITGHSVAEWSCGYVKVTDWRLGAFA
jgi:COP9 signalosome complex subunit 4